MDETIFTTLVYVLFACLGLVLCMLFVVLILVYRLTKLLKRAKISTAHSNPVFELGKNSHHEEIRRRTERARSVCSLPPWEQGSSESVEVVPSRKTSKNVPETSPHTRKSVVDPPQAANIEEENSDDQGSELFEMD